MRFGSSRTGVRLLALALAAVAASSCAGAERRRGKKWWLVSVAALYGANLLDAHTSRGKFELNPALRDGDGRFDFSRAMAVKLSGTSAAVLLQLLVSRKAPGEEIYSASAALNFAGTAALAALAVRNRGMPLYQPRVTAGTEGLPNTAAFRPDFAEGRVLERRGSYPLFGSSRRLAGR